MYVEINYVVDISYLGTTSVKTPKTELRFYLVFKCHQVEFSLHFMPLEIYILFSIDKDTFLGL